jgi:hypothetical protein
MTQFPARHKYWGRKTRFSWAAARHSVKEAVVLGQAREQAQDLQLEERSLWRGGGPRILPQ